LGIVISEWESSKKILGHISKKKALAEVCEKTLIASDESVTVIY